jgi:hypothetical protein
MVYPNGEVAGRVVAITPLRASAASKGRPASLLTLSCLRPPGVLLMVAHILGLICVRMLVPARKTRVRDHPISICLSSR